MNSVTINDLKNDSQAILVLLLDYQHLTTSCWLSPTTVTFILAANHFKSPKSFIFGSQAMQHIKVKNFLSKKELDSNSDD